MLRGSSGRRYPSRLFRGDFRQAFFAWTGNGDDDGHLPFRLSDLPGDIALAVMPNLSELKAFVVELEFLTAFLIQCLWEKAILCSESPFECL